MTTENEICARLIKVAENQRKLFSSSYHGPNCRTCNRNPSILRRFRWRIEDVIWRLKKWYYREESIPYTLDDYLL